MDEPTVVLPDLDRQPRHTLSSGHRNRRRPGILMLIAHFPPAIGGTETQAHTLATGIARLGHRVTVLTLARTGDPAREMLDGVAVERALAGVGRGVLYAATYGISLLRHLRRIRTGHGVLHAYHLYLEAMAAVWLGRRFDLPAIARIACGGIDGDFSRLRRTGLIWGLPLLRRLHRVVAISAETEAELEAHGFAADRVVRIPNGIDPIRFAPAPDPERARVEAGLDRETVLFLGRLDGQKGLETALAAWTQVTARRPTARLSIAGDGPLRPVLEARARELGLGNTVQFLGLRPDPERLLRASQVFMLPSRSEGMSNSLLGAMATGVGCVATRVGGNSELLEHGVNGLLIPPGDAVALAEAVVAILEDTALARRLGMAARATVMERYRMDRIVRQYADLYSAVVGGLG